MNIKCWSGNLKVDTLGKPRRKYEDNTKMDLKDTGCDRIDYILQ